MPDFGIDRSVVEAASWRLASELVRRHPSTLRIRHTRPGGGQYDCLTIMSATGREGRIDLNRAGRIHLGHRFDGRKDQEWEPVEWDDYLRAEPRAFLDWLEQSAGLPTPTHVPTSTSRTLTCRILSAVAATAFKSVHPIEIQPGWIDTSGWASSRNHVLDLFPAIPDVLRRRQEAEPVGYRFWIVLRDDVPILAFEEEECAVWTPRHDDSLDLMDLFDRSRRNVLVATAQLLLMADTV